MRKNRILVVLIGFALIAAIMVMPVAAKTIYVTEAGWWIEGGEFNASSCPVDDAVEDNPYLEDGDTVFVYNGTYEVTSADNDVLAIEKSITLKGEGADVVTFDLEYDPTGDRNSIGIEPSAIGAIIEGLKIVNSSKGIGVGAPDCIIRNCVFEGLTASYAPHITASNTTFENNVVANGTGSCGLTIPKNGTKVINNTIINEGVGILLYPSAPAPNGIIIRNKISSNGKGIWLYNADPDNKIYLNDFMNNTVSVAYGGTPPSTIYWNSTEQIEYVYGSTEYTNYLGNYWSPQYTGTDGDGDGIGDTAYDIPGSATDKDYRPLMAGYENYLGAPAGEEKPDLNVTAITPPANIFATESNSINATIANTGSGDAGAFNVSLSAEGTVVDRASVAGLGAGASTEVSLEWTPAASGTYELCVVADCDGVIDESDETNNVTCRSVYATEPGATLEYTIKIADYTLALYDGGEVVVPVEIQNASDIAGGSANVTFNASVVKVKAVSAGHFGTPAANIDNTSGFVHVSAGRAFAVGREEAVLANLLFEGISEGYTALNVQNALLNFEDGNTTTPAAINGSITVETWMLGDLNHNNMIDTGDATLVLRMVVGLEPTNVLGDMNQNGMIDTGDATLILRTVVGLPI